MGKIPSNRPVKGGQGGFSRVCECKTPSIPLDKGMFILFLSLFAFIGCDHPARVDIGELVEALNGLDKDEVVDTDEFNTDDDLLVCEEGEKRCESQWVMICSGGTFEQFEECVDCGPLCQCAESAGNAWCEHTDPGPDDIDVQPDDSVVIDGDAVDEEPDVDYCGECLVPDEDYEEPDLSAEAEAETDVVPDGDVAPDRVTCDSNICIDKATGLMWEKNLSANTMSHDAAVTYCDGRTTGTHDDWRLPTITELRTLIRGCIGTEEGGACAVVDPDCLSFSACYSTPDCTCADNAGPGVGGCYWDSDVWGTVCAALWSSSIDPVETGQAWQVGFVGGTVIDHAKSSLHNVKCVRDATLTRTTKQWGGSASEYAHSVATDANGNIFVTGRTDGTFDGNTHMGLVDIFLTKWTADGTKAWTKQWGTSADDYGWSVAVDSSGNVFVAGWTEGDLDGNTLSGTINIFLTKWNADGSKAWTKQWGEDGFNIGRAVAVDDDGNIYVTGMTESALDGNTKLGGSDIFLTKWATSGAKSWTKQWGAADFDSGFSVAVDSVGNIFVAGITQGTLDGNTALGGDDAFLTKWASDGTKAWTRQWGTVSGDTISSVAVDINGNVFVAGDTAGTTDGNVSHGGNDVILTKWDNEGVHQWTKQWGTANNDVGESVALDEYGNVFVTGRTAAAMDGNVFVGVEDIFLTKFNVNGTLLWTVQWGTTAEDIGYSVAVDSSNRILVAGSTHDGLDGNTCVQPLDPFLSIFSVE